MLTETEVALCAARKNTLDPDLPDSLHYIGNYTRRLQTTLPRMMENALDWEHLPYVHPSSFSRADIIDSGSWGWRAKLGLPIGGHQIVDLILDAARHYWVSTVVSGMGQGTEIHTQAMPVSDTELEVDVRFYLPFAPPNAEVSAQTLTYLQQQYATLYDEDQGLMSGRQQALADRQRWRGVQTMPSSPNTQLSMRVAALTELDVESTTTVELAGHRYALRHVDGEWVAHSAVCPHLLGPLQDATLDTDGTVACPWHGYRFDIRTGQNLDGKCGALKPAPQLQVLDGALWVSLEDKPAH